MTTSQERIEIVRRELQRLCDVAGAILDRVVLDRASEQVGVQTALLAALSAGTIQGHCAAEGLRSPLPHGIAPNVRALLEGLVISRYLTDSTADSQEQARRLDRYFRGARQQQVRFRKALLEYPVLQEALEIDLELADREAAELQEVEKALPISERLGKHWSGLPQGLRSMAEAVGLGADYAFQYRVNSGVLHGARPWDFVELEPTGQFVIASFRRRAPLAFQLGSDALRYLAWTTNIAHETGAVSMYQSEQTLIESYRYLLHPLDELITRKVLSP